jgi:hypothetical protein
MCSICQKVNGKSIGAKLARRGCGSVTLRGAPEAGCGIRQKLTVWGVGGGAGWAAFANAVLGVASRTPWGRLLASVFRFLPTPAYPWGSGAIQGGVQHKTTLDN